MTPQTPDEIVKEFKERHRAWLAFFAIDEQEMILKFLRTKLTSFGNTRYREGVGDKKDLLTEYTNWLLKHNYCDADVYAEEPTAVDRFLSARSHE